MKKIVFAAVALVAAVSLADGKVVRIYNAQKSASKTPATAMVSQLKSGICFPAEIVDGAPEGCPFADGKAGFVIILEENEKCPMKMTCSPDDGIVRVNVAALKADKPDEKTLDRRVLKLMWRGFCLALGSGYTRNPMCLLKPTDGSLKAIDDLGSCCPAPEAFNSMMLGAARRGLAPEK